MAHEDYTRHVKLDEAQRDALLNRLNQPHAMGTPISKRPAGNRRRDARWEYRHADIALLVEHPGGGVSRLLVCARNLSAGGISFLHGGFLHPGSKCKLSLLQNDGGSTAHTGAIISCRHIERTLHEVGVHFEKRIDPALFSHQTQNEAEARTSVSLASLDGCVLLIDGSEADQKLVRFYLESSGATVKTVADGTEGKTLAEKGVYIAIITELTLNGTSGIEITQSLRTAGVKIPIVAITADERMELQKQAMDAGCTAVLIKPLDFSKLTALLREHVPMSIKTADVQPVFSTHWDDQQMRPLIESFLKTLETQVQNLCSSLTTGNNDSMRSICLALKGSATGYGYPAITDSAQTLLKVMDAGTAADEVKKTLDELVGHCAAACRAHQSSV